jgi:hypothetical protein
MFDSYDFALAHKEFTKQRDDHSLQVLYTRYLLNKQLNYKKATRNQGITHAHRRRRIYTEISLHFAT